MNNNLLLLNEILSEKKLDAVLISSQPLISYFTNYHGFSQIEREAYLLITKKNKYIFTDLRYSEATIKIIHGFTTLIINSEFPISHHLKNLLNKNARVGFEANDLSVSEFIILKKTNINLISISLRNIRIKKNKNEINTIRKTARIAKKAFFKTKNQLKIGISENEVSNIFENEIRKQNAELSFKTIVAFGKNSSIPHHLSGKTRLKKDDVILIDFGAKWNNYCSDITRTFFMGSISNEWKKIYNTVLLAQKYSVEYIKSKIAIKPVNASEVDKIAREYIISQGFNTIPHSLGHGVGLEVHEAPALSINSSDKLTDGMVFSIEPGIYIPGVIGIRIEDMFVINNSEIIKLT